MQISTGLTGKHFSPAQGCLSFELINHRESCFPQCPPSGTQTQDAYLVKECYHRPLVPTTRHHEGNHLAGWQSLQMGSPPCVPNPFIDTQRPHVSALELVLRPEVTVRKTSFSPPSNRKSDQAEQGLHLKEPYLSSTAG